ncbi:MAG: family 43 glycosylhydrolase [Chitinophagaceae bacterium]|jgi:beta-xylosidase|nr:family 43 glycosylhydrolase [Chitinophagaceae bacterium]
MDRRNYIILVALFSMIILFERCAPERLMHSANYSGNPVLPGNFADPSILSYRDTFYIYATTGSEATVWRSADFENWKLTKLNWPTSMGQPDIWAPAVRQGTDEKFYLYTSTNHNIYAGVADHPRGPFKNILGDDSIFIKNRQWWNKMHSIDADCFIDDDGQAYLYWGSGFDFVDGICAVGKLNSDMASFKEDPILVTPEGFFEGPHMMKRNGIYYLMYSDGLYYDSTYKVRYATSASPMGPFEQGKNSPVLKSTPDGRISGPGHHYTFSSGDQYYILYHRHAYPFYKGIRQVAIDKMEFDSDGSIKTIIPAETGVPLHFIKKEYKRDYLIPVKVEASSFTDSNYNAEKAFDKHNGTLWATNQTNVPAWIRADFGKQVNISNCELVFDHVMGDYNYTIEYSTNGNEWLPFAEGNNASAGEWPVEHHQSIKARFIRVTINNDKQRERIGLWEVKIR